MLARGQLEVSYVLVLYKLFLAFRMDSWLAMSLGGTVVKKLVGKRPSSCVLF